VSSGVQNDQKALIEFRNRLIRFNRTLDTEYRAMVGGWRQLEPIWRDEQYRKFGGSLEEVGKGIERYLKATEKHEHHLLGLIQAMDAYLKAR
jgi:hypothetical protein